MAEHKSKRVEVSGIEDKWQIIATFAAWVVYQGKTSKCQPSFDFLDNWHITHSPQRKYHDFICTTDKCPIGLGNKKESWIDRLTISTGDPG